MHVTYECEVANPARRLVTFALKNLQRMRLPSGLYCFDWPYGGRLRGESLRYSLMALLGYQRAAAAGYEVPDLDALWQSCIARRWQFTPGDIGLALWADSRRHGADAERLIGQFEDQLRHDHQLAQLVGMEIAWLLLGLTHAAEMCPSADVPLKRVVEHLEEIRRSPSGMYRHDGASRVRRYFPNFATEIYTVLALVAAGRAGHVADAGEHAAALADHLVRLQLDDGGWPWLYHSERAVVVEPYEIYSVHQDAMAPMAMIELTELTGDRRYLDAAVRGASWSFGANELGANLFVDGAGFAHRSIRRVAARGRATLAANAVATLTSDRPPLVGRTRHVDVNQTCRPYHLGWILEAWAGREYLAETVAAQGSERSR